ncbi:MAG: hypothetical protein A2138_03960 [Deltaproteobacteria bacterium RBG_16_71_12]|nr:MAG: hypothetical protein A2138_03960 [Deltaproteobacteria bacterium RBG_16_71_12]
MTRLEHMIAPDADLAASPTGGPANLRLLASPPAHAVAAPASSQAASVADLLGGLRVNRAGDGTLTITAPAASAPLLASIFEGLAGRLRAAA